MKTCPICNAKAFDDAAVCYGCLHRFEKEGESDDCRQQLREGESGNGRQLPSENQDLPPASSWEQAAAQAGSPPIATQRSSERDQRVQPVQPAARNLACDSFPCSDAPGLVIHMELQGLYPCGLSSLSDEIRCASAEAPPFAASFVPRVAVTDDGVVVALEAPQVSRRLPRALPARERTRARRISRAAYKRPTRRVALASEQ